MAQTKTTIESPRIEPDQPVDEDRELLRQWGFLDDTEDVPEEPEVAPPPAGATPFSAFDQFDPNSDTNRRLKESLSGLSGVLSEFMDRPDVQSAASVIPAFGGAPSTGLILKGSGAAGILDDIRNAPTYRNATDISDYVLQTDGADLWKAVAEYIRQGDPTPLLTSTAEDLSLMRGLTSTLLKRFVTDETRGVPRLLSAIPGLDDTLLGRLNTLNPLYRAVSPVSKDKRFEGLSWSLDPAFMKDTVANWAANAIKAESPQGKPYVGEILSDRVKPREILASFLTQPGLPWYTEEREFIRLPPKILAGLRGFNETLGRVRTPRFTDFVGNSDAAVPKAVDAPLSIDTIKAWFKEKTFMSDPEVAATLADPELVDYYRKYIKSSGWTP